MDCVDLNFPGPKDHKMLDFDSSVVPKDYTLHCARSKAHLSSLEFSFDNIAAFDPTFFQVMFTHAGCHNEIVWHPHFLLLN